MDSISYNGQRVRVGESATAMQTMRCVNFH